MKNLHKNREKSFADNENSFGLMFNEVYSQ